MAKTEIYPIPLGTSCSYLIKEDGLIMVDAGFAGQGLKFKEELENLSIKPNDISLILITHGHWDHIGSAKEIKDLTGAKVAANQHDKDWVEQAIIPELPSRNLWGRIMERIFKMRSASLSFPGTPVDIVLGDEDFSLEPYGIHGKALHTPGHSPGSMSVLLDTGDAFVGDLAVNGLPVRIGPGMSLWADDPDVIKESWRLLISRGAKWIYPAHGKPFKSEALQKFL